MSHSDRLHQRALRILLTGRLARYPRGSRGAQLRRKLERFARYHRRWLGAREIEGFTFGEKITRRRPTGQPALIIYVRRKIRQHERIKRPIPKWITIPTVGVFATDVVTRGEFRHHGASFLGTVRPLLPGICISPRGGAIGTLGCFVRKANSAATYLLSCAHVLTNNFLEATSGLDVEQSGTGHHSGSAAAKVAVSAGIVPIKFTPDINDFSNRVDAGIAEVVAPEALPVTPAMRLTGVRPASEGVVAKGTAVRMVGCITGDAAGVITDTHVAKSFFYDAPQHPDGEVRAGFMELVEADYEAREGDSGALVMSADGRILGLHMGSWTTGSLFCRFGVAAARLGVVPF